jgi:hypothetical protein
LPKETFIDLVSINVPFIDETIMDALSPFTRQVLRGAGWHPLRHIDTDQMKKEIETNGFVFHREGRRLLEVFGGLEFKLVSDGPLRLLPSDAIAYLDAEQERPYLLRLFASEPCPVGQSTWTSIFVLADGRIVRFNINMHRYCTYGNTSQFLNALIDDAFSSLTQFRNVPPDLIPGA